MNYTRTAIPLAGLTGLFNRSRLSDRWRRWSHDRGASASVATVCLNLFEGHHRGPGARIGSASWFPPID
jgi:hypothetical protein